MFAFSRLIPSSDGSSSSSSSTLPPTSSRSPSSPQHRELVLLLSRLSSSTLHEDRRSAIQSLYDLTSQYPDLPLTHSSLDQLLTLSDSSQRSDPDLSRLALQSIHNLLQPNQPNGDRTSAYELITLFSHHPPFVHVLLSFLSSPHFHLRFTSMQILTLLLLSSSARSSLQSTLTSNPTTISTITELLDDSEEIIRNEALLLVEALVVKSEEIQKMVAFNGVFDVLMMGVKRDGGLVKAGVVGEDAMRIVVALVRENKSNAMLFGEMGCGKMLGVLVQGMIGDITAGERVGNESSNALCFVLDVVWFVSRSASLATLSPLVAPLVDLSLVSTLPFSVRCMALSLVAILVDGNKHNQSTLAGHPLPPSLSSTSSTLLHLIQTAVQSPSPLLSSLSLHTLLAYFNQNRDGQLQCVFSFTPSSSSSSFGPFLLDSLFSSSPHHRSISLRVVTALLHSNPDTQRMLLKLPIGEDTTGGTITWSDRYLDLLFSLHTQPINVAIPLLVLLCQWMDGCSDVVEALLSRPSLVQFIVTLATTADNEYIRGLAMYTFLLCLHQLPTAPSSATFLTPPSLLSLIQHSITLDLFKQTILSLHSSPTFTTLRSTSPPDLNPFHRHTQRRLHRGDDLAEHVFVVEGEGEEVEGDEVGLIEKKFVVRFDKVVEGMNDRLLALLTSVLNEGGGAEREGVRLREENMRLRGENEALKAQLMTQVNGAASDRTRELESVVQKQKEEITTFQQQLLELQQRPSVGSAVVSSSSLQRQYDELMAEHEDLLILLAQYAQAEDEESHTITSSSSDKPNDEEKSAHSAVTTHAQASEVLPIADSRQPYPSMSTFTSFPPHSTQPPPPLLYSQHTPASFTDPSSNGHSSHANGVVSYPPSSSHPYYASWSQGGGGSAPSALSAGRPSVPRAAGDFR